MLKNNIQLKSGEGVNKSGSILVTSINMASKVWSHRRWLQILLEQRANVNARGSMRYIYHQQGGHAEVVQILVEHGANVNAEGQWMTCATAASEVATQRWCDPRRAWSGY